MIKKILFIDSEGGHGGSSHSLFALIYGIKQIYPDIEITVLCRLKSNLISIYKEMGITVIQNKLLPKLSSVNSLKGNIIEFIKFKLFIWPKSRTLRKFLLKDIDKYNLIHINHEYLFYLSNFLKNNTTIKISGHIRTLCPINLFSKFQLSNYIKSLNCITFISENEYQHIRSFKLHISNYQICNNPVFLNRVVIPDKTLTTIDGIKVAIVGNFSLERGIDRIFSIAKKLPKDSNITFIIVGDKIVNENIPKSLKLGFKKGDDLASYTKEIGLDKIIKFIGFNDKPYNITSACNFILRLSRTNSPWGRDIIEAFALKKPVLACGVDNTFIKHK